MKLNKIHMKKVLLISLILLSGFTYLNAQESDFKISVETVSASNSETSDGKIIVRVEGGNPEYVFRLLDKAFWDGGIVLETSEATSTTSYSFEGLKPGKYFITATDKSDITQFLFVTINNE